MVDPGTPRAEVEIDAVRVQRLLRQQHPDLAHWPLELVEAGFDNVMFRLGPTLAVRLPRRQLAADLIRHELTWLPRLAPHLSLPVPVPCRRGQPSPVYPWSWTVVPWLPGDAADQGAMAPHQAPLLATFLRQLHRPAPAAAPHNPFRSVLLSQRAEAVDRCLERLGAKTNAITSRIQQRWHRAVEAPRDVPLTWIHGDLHGRNLLVHQGHISGIIDWGDMAAGDRATDLAALWMLFPDRRVRETAIAAYGPVSTATRWRAQGWAILFGALLLDTGLVDHPRHAAMGAKILETLNQDPL